MAKSVQLQEQYKDQVKLCQGLINKIHVELQKWENELPSWPRLEVLNSQEVDLAHILFNLGSLTNEEKEKYRI